MILRILGDGNFFFRVISQFLYGQQDRHMEIREAAMNEIKNNVKYYSCYIDAEFDVYCGQMGRVREWTDHVAITEMNKKAKVVVNLVYKNQIHYDLILNLEQYLSPGIFTTKTSNVKKPKTLKPIIHKKIYPQISTNVNQSDNSTISPQPVLSKKLKLFESKLGDYVQFTYSSCHERWPADIYKNNFINNGLLL